METPEAITQEDMPQPAPVKRRRRGPVPITIIEHYDPVPGATANAVAALLRGRAGR